MTERGLRKYTGANDFVLYLLYLILEKGSAKIVFDRAKIDVELEIVKEMNRSGVIFKTHTTVDEWTLLYSDSFKIYIKPLKKDLGWPKPLITDQVLFRVR